VRRKTIIALLLCSIVALPLIFSGGLQAFQQYIKYTVEERLNDEELVIVSIPLAQVQWMEEGREILVHGKMFDIKSYSEKDGNLIATGVYDERETAVIELLSHFNDQQQNQLLIKILLLAQTFAGLVYITIQLPYIICFLKHSTFFQVKKTSPHLFSFYPPPRHQLS